MSSIYRPLDTSKGEIRLLRILPCCSSISSPRKAERIQCILKYVALDEIILPYHALSYIWVDEDLDVSDCEEADLRDDGVEIVLDSEKITVTHNLWLALAHFREIGQGKIAHELVEVGFDEDFWLWIDALCINQSDVEERNLQVKRMRTIYQRAKTMRAWLGIDSQYPGLAIELAWMIERLFVEGEIEEDASTLDLKLVIEPWLQRALLDANFQNYWRALIFMFKRRYWGRMWIIQELISNKRAWVHIGLGTAPLKNVLVLALAIQSLIAHTNIESESIYQGDNLVGKIYITAPNLSIPVDMWIYSFEQSQDYDLLKLLVRYRNQSCSDLRDKVYGLVGLAYVYPNLEGSTDALRIDYSSSLEDVYKEAARYVIRGSDRLDLICTTEKQLCSCTPGHQLNTRLPSWVPDWSCINEENKTWKTLHMNVHGRVPEFFKAAGETKALASISLDGEVLTCRGIRLGVIHELYQLYRVCAGRYPTQLNLLNYALSECRKLGLNELPEMVQISLYQTLRATYLGPKSNFPTQENFVVDSLDALDAVGSLISPGTENILQDLMEHTALFSCSVFPNQRLPLFGTSPLLSKANDIIAIIYGCDWPVLLREIPNTDGKTNYEVVSEAYIHFFMYGEVLEDIKDGRFDEVDFRIH